MSLRFHPAAVEEIQDAYDFYFDKDPVVAADFLAQVDQGIEAVSGTPLRFPKFAHGTRRKLFRKFPHQLIYIIREQEILILAVAHPRKKPNYWAGRRSLL